MSPLQLLVLSLPGAYFNSVLLVWFFVLFSEKGLVFSISRSFSALKPLLRCLLFGIVPGTILSNIIAIFGTNSVFSVSVPVLIGAVVSAWILHRDILAHVQNKRTVNIAIAIIFLAMVALVGWVSLQFEPMK